MKEHTPAVIAGILLTLFTVAAIPHVFAANTASDAKIEVPGNIHLYESNLTAVDQINPNGGTTTLGGPLNMTNQDILGLGSASDGSDPSVRLDLSRGDLLDGNDQLFQYGPTASLSAHLMMQGNIMTGVDSIWHDQNGSLVTNHGLDFESGGDVLLTSPTNLNLRAGGNTWKIEQENGALIHNGFNANLSFNDFCISDSVNNCIELSDDGYSANPGMVSNVEQQWLVVDADGSAGGPYDCHIDGVDGSGNGDWNCDGTKNWMHEVNATHDAYYTSQESPEVRAVVEGSTTVSNGATTVALPWHFTETVSADQPDMTVQVTPHSLATTAVTARNRTHVTIAADTGDDVQVDYRVTGIREGYEDKDVVRPRAQPPV